jgi:hypothetical protein
MALNGTCIFILDWIKYIKRKENKDSFMFLIEKYRGFLGIACIYNLILLLFHKTEQNIQATQTCFGSTVKCKQTSSTAER